MSLPPFTKLWTLSSKLKPKEGTGVGQGKTRGKWEVALNQSNTWAKPYLSENLASVQPLQSCEVGSKKWSSINAVTYPAQFFALLKSCNGPQLLPPAAGRAGSRWAALPWVLGDLLCLLQAQPRNPTCCCNPSCPSTCLSGWQTEQPRHLLPSPEHQILDTGDLWGHQAELGELGSDREL